MKIFNPAIFYLLINLCLINKPTVSNCQSRINWVDNYLNKIRGSRAELTAFFSQMPKGADLHNHFTGSVYAETYWNFIVKNKYCVDTVSLRNFPPNIGDTTKSSKQFGVNIFSPLYENLRQRVLQNWSVKDYYDALAPSDKHFFDAFAKFPSDDSLINEGLQELKTRAKAENIAYMELMFKSVSLPKLNPGKNYDSALRYCEKMKDTMLLKNLLSEIVNSLIKDYKIDTCATSFCNSLETLHHLLKIDDESFTMRYLTYANRTKQPFAFFTQLYTAFRAAAIDTLVVGVNILSPEDNEVSMQDYWLHMQMFRYCNSLFKNTINYSMHAGELTEGLVKPEDLTFHIHDAVYIAGAKRIGHGVDMPYEKNCFEIMKYMHDNHVAVEINLSSNEFILKVKDDMHPLMMYFKSKVPIVISSDDPGILRTSLTEQFVLLAYRYKEISYSDIKQFVYNSIEYSFIKNRDLKNQMIADLDKRFGLFEQNLKDRDF